MAPIHNAVFNGNLNGVRALLNSGVNVNARYHHGLTSLHEAVRYGRLAIVHELLDRGANINARTHDGKTPLIWAAVLGRLAIVRELLDRGANVNARNNNGQTALHWAARLGRLEMVRLLLERGANTNEVLNRRNIRANVKNKIIKHKAGLTIAKHYKALNMRRRLSFIGSNMAKSLPNNMTLKILTARKNK